MLIVREAYSRARGMPCFGTLPLDVIIWRMFRFVLCCVVLCVFREADEGLLARDHYVVSTCLKMGVPVACVVGGGYDSDKVVLAARHSTVFRAAFRAWRDFDDRARWR